MHGISICRHFGKQGDVVIGNLFSQMARHANFNILDTDRAAWLIVQHAALPDIHVDNSVCFHTAQSARVIKIQILSKKRNLVISTRQ
jgi:hypothetical protein